MYDGRARPTFLAPSDRPDDWTDDLWQTICAVRTIPLSWTRHFFMAAMGSLLSIITRNGRLTLPRSIRLGRPFLRAWAMQAQT